MFYLYNWNLIQTFKFIPCQLAQICTCSVFSFVCPGTKHVCSVCVCECSIVISKLIKMWKVKWKTRKVSLFTKATKLIRCSGVKPLRNVENACDLRGQLLLEGIKSEAKPNQTRETDHGRRAPRLLMGDADGILMMLFFPPMQSRLIRFFSHGTLTS